MPLYTCTKCKGKYNSKNPITRNVFPAGDDERVEALMSQFMWRKVKERDEGGYTVTLNCIVNVDGVRSKSAAIKHFFAVLREVTPDVAKYFACDHHLVSPDPPSV